ncbi:MAG: adenylate/guanylate cyclase domain-containing protein [Planctomycetes bacterium]|nr:adenylate/guanylate cyclase domain-containing protein [Planctomycetota bacterium]
MHQRLVYSDTLDQALEAGRQRSVDEPMFQKLVGSASGAGCERLNVAPLSNLEMPRKLIRFLPGPQGQLQVINPHDSAQLKIDTSTTLAPNGACNAPLPFLFSKGELTIRVEAGEATPAFESLGQQTLAPGSWGQHRAAPLVSQLASPATIQVTSTDDVLAWFQTISLVLEQATSSSEFFNAAALALVDLIKLDAGAVVLFDEGRTSVAAKHLSPLLGEGIDEWRPSQQILTAVRQKKETIWQLPAAGNNYGSIDQLQALVASPILNRSGEVIGALYGDRKRSTVGRSIAINKLEAQLVEMLARGVAAGVARLKEERTALAAQVQFEQFFGAELARSLNEDPHLLSGRDAEVTVLFCDIRGFSRISERLGPVKTFEWIGETMQVLSDCIVRHHGVLVDYIGDELLAMWGAPKPERDHAALASAAAKDMIRSLPELSARWQAVLQEPIRVGVGVNTGTARVGNTGSLSKFKYGPLGPMVNLASRVQGMNKYLRTELLVTAETRRLLPADVPSRRLCSVQVVNISQPVELFELPSEPTESWHSLKSRYEQALQMFEERRYRAAARLLAEIMDELPDDGPTMLLLGRCVEALTSNEPCPSYWVPPGK